MVGKSTDQPQRGRPRKSEKEPFKPGVSGAVAASAASNRVRRRILVVDDNPVVLKAFENRLKAEGFDVATTDNAGCVVGETTRFKAELILLDIHFPPSGGMEWNGFTVMQWVRRFPELNGIPIILISGAEGAGYKEKSLASGAFAFFEKPVEFADLLAAIQRALPGAPAS